MTTEWTRTKVVDELRTMLAEEEDIPIETITAQSRLQADLGLDSLGIVELVMAAEERFEVEFPETDDAGSDVAIGAVADTIVQALSQGAPA